MHGFELSEGQLCLGSLAIPLAPKERAVLGVLMESSGRAVSGAALIDKVWGASPIGTESLHRCISTLRNKLKPHAGAPAIRTVYGYGYRMDIPAQAPVTRTAAENSEAMERFRQANEVLGRRSKPEVSLVLKRLAQLRQTHPDFLPGYVFGAHAELVAAMLGYDDPEASARKVRALSAQILTLNPSSAEALSVRGFAAVVIDGDDNGFDDLDAAIVADPRDWLARHYRGWALAGKGEFGAAISDYEEAQRSQPETPGLLGSFGHVLCCAGMPDRALAMLRNAAELVRMVPSGNASHAINASVLGFHDEAIEAAERVAAIPDMSATLVVTLPDALARAGRHAEAALWLARIEEDADTSPALPMVAPALLALGDVAAARAALESARASHCPYRHLQRFDPRLSSLVR